MIDFNVFDTETIRGKAFLIADKSRYAETENFQQVIDFLFSTPEKIWFTYNLDYDACAILKHVPVAVLNTLFMHTNCTYSDVDISYLPSKILRLTYRKREIEIYDLLQFYNMSLDAASEKFLGENKMGIPKKVKSDMGAYWTDPKWKKKIIKYCMRDALLTYRLGLHFLGMLDAAGIKTRKFYSTGYLAGKFLRRVDLGNVPPEVSAFVERNYYGGRNECTKRGMIGDVYIFDINSAYPSVIRELKSLKGAIYRDSKHIDSDADYFYAEIKVTFREGLYTYPIPIKDKTHGFIYYPRLVDATVVVNQFEYDIIQRLQVATNLQVLRVINIYCKDASKPFLFVNDLFAERKKSDSHNYVFKIVLNSLYGKMYERKKSYRKLSGRESFAYDKKVSINLHAKLFIQQAEKRCKESKRYWEKKCQCATCKCCRMVSRRARFHKVDFDPVWTNENGEQNLYRTIRKNGKRHNAIYASLITSSIRCKIFEVANRMGKDFIACFTDSIFSLSPIPDEFISDDIGKFSLKAVAKNLLMIGSGIYEYDCEEINKQTGKLEIKSYTRFRGFTHHKGLRRKIKTKNTSISIDSLSRVSWGLVVAQTAVYKPDDYNVLMHKPRNLNLNFDHKRIWEKDFNSGNLALKTLIDSIPR
jgi:hypothetical protein